MSCLCPAFRRRLLIACSLFAVGVAFWATFRAQVPVDPDYPEAYRNVLFDGDEEVGQVYRDVVGSSYTEHWVLYSNYTFDRIRKAGPSIEIVAEPGGYRGVRDFLNRVPFPQGSRYVIARCEEFDRLP